MPSTNPRKLPSGRWQARWRELDGKQTSKTFGTQALAKDHLVDVRTRLKSERDARESGLDAALNPDPSLRTVEESAAKWLQNPKWSQSTRDRNESIVANYILPVWGNSAIGSIDREAAQDWVNHLMTAPRVTHLTTNRTEEDGPLPPLGPRSIKKTALVLSGILEREVRNNKLAANPCSKLDFPPEPDDQHVFLTATQVEHLAAHARGHSDAVMFLAYSGLRYSEWAGLKVKYVSIKDGTVTIAQVLDAARSKLEGRTCWKAPKGKKHRTIRVAPFLTEILRERIQGKDDDALVFPSRAGTPIGNRNFRRDVLKPSSTRAGFTFEVKPHALRHTAASIIIAEGATPGAVRKYLGHKKTSTTMDIYVGLFKDEEDRIAAKQEAVRAKAQKKAAKQARKRASEATSVDGMWMETRTH